MMSDIPQLNFDVISKVLDMRMKVRESVGISGSNIRSTRELRPSTVGGDGWPVTCYVLFRRLVRAGGRELRQGAPQPPAQAAAAGS